MKKIVLIILMAALSGLCFAQGRFHRQRINLDECYELSIDVKRLSEKLELTDVQMMYVQIINENMVKDIDKALSENGRSKSRKIQKAIDKNIKSMKKVLTKDQFDTYVVLFFTTIGNNISNTLRDIGLPARPIQRNIRK